MADVKASAAGRSSASQSTQRAPHGNASDAVWHPDDVVFPMRKELPPIDGAPSGAAWFWGKNDNLGRLNLLTPTRVLAASREILSGEIVPVNLPLNVPAAPGFNREAFKHEIKPLHGDVVFDDLYILNTQSGTQWDGFRHFSHMKGSTFYNGTKSTDIVGPHANDKCSIHFWAEHGIAGRGILLDYWGYAKKVGITYDPYEQHAITYDELVRCGKDQDIDIRPQAQGGDVKVGDLLFLRTGWVEAYFSKTPEEGRELAARHSSTDESNMARYVGVAQKDAVIDWLHDCYFAAVAGDNPAFEVWPSLRDFFLHEHILALWGMPIAEMVDLEKLARRCRERKRWTFFFTSAPANCPGGIASHVNGTVIL